MRIHILLFGILFFYTHTLLAQSDDALTLLSQKLTINLTDDSLKVSEIYFWIVKNIDYDHGFRHRIEGDTTLTQESYNVIKRKKAVCIGYAKLFKTLCELNNIKAYVVEGVVKNKQGYVESEGHAWNVVLINKNYYLLDATWGAADGLLQHKYFLMNPSVFSENHLPHDPIWQLLVQPIDYQCFTKNINCNTKTKDIDFRDSLLKIETMDSLSKVYSTSIRTLNYNPNDIQAMRAIASYYSQKAFEGITRYNQLRSDIKEKKRKANQRNEVLKLLDDIIIQVETAKMYYERLANLVLKNRYTDVQLNLDLIHENLQNLQKERLFVESFFKD
jgi:transglutaminase/protease-like cytokinesis protein 3